ncbi:MAG: peptidoglycan DD-metalloendopeptidase family protein [Clostridia bacterium]|nr:peptidoglycan DD-metalloendopeptidase family protein [Clostridia bacterium]
MNKKRLALRLTALLVAAVCFFSSMIPSSVPSVYAADDKELKNLQNQYDNLEKEIAENEAQLSKIQGQQKDTKSQLSSLNKEIDSMNSQISILSSRINLLESKIATLNANIEDTTKQIAETEENIEKASKDIAETEASMQEAKELLLGRIRENYIAGESSMLEVIFSSNDLSSYFERQELISRVSEEDAALISELSAKVKELNELKVLLEKSEEDLKVKSEQLADEKGDLQDQSDDLSGSRQAQQSKMNEVSVKQQQVQSQLSELDQNSAEYKAIIARQRKEREELDRQIDEYIRVHGSSAGDTPDAAYANDGKMAWPVKFQSYISCGYGYYSDGSPHWGTDICAVGGNSKGRPFCAAQGGKVILAKNDGNWNYGFGNYCVIDHGDGKQTLYAHSSGLKVHEGQIVQKGQEIGYIGDTGNVTGPHLHFEVRIKKADGSVSRVNPLNYVKNTTA